MRYRRRPQRPEGADHWRERLLVVETEALLSGRYVERRWATGEPVPPWAWINRLAHGTLEDLSDVAREWRYGGLHHEWRRARAFLASELLDTAPTQASLAQLQRELLVPLELKLSGPGCLVPLRPQQLVSLVLAALSSPSAPPNRRGY